MWARIGRLIKADMGDIGHNDTLRLLPSPTEILVLKYLGTFLTDMSPSQKIVTPCTVWFLEDDGFIEAGSSETNNEGFFSSC